MQVKITHENNLIRLWFKSVSNIPILNFRKFYTFCKVCNLTFWLIYAVLALTHILNMEQSLRDPQVWHVSLCLYSPTQEVTRSGRFQTQEGR